jgi:Na+/proline symporter
LARDLLGRVGDFETNGLRLVRISVVVIGLASLGMAYLGESAYSLLESGYELGMVSLMAPLTFAIYSKRGGRAAVLASMLSGTMVWLAHAAMGWEDFLAIEGFWVPMGLVCTAMSFAAFPLTVWIEQRRGPSAE